MTDRPSRQYTPYLPESGKALLSDWRRWQEYDAKPKPAAAGGQASTGNSNSNRQAQSSVPSSSSRFKPPSTAFNPQLRKSSPVPGRKYAVPKSRKPETDGTARNAAQGSQTSAKKL